MKNLMLVFLFGLLTFQVAQADPVIAAPPGLPSGHHYPGHVYPPHYPAYPRPAYPYPTPFAPVVTCYARGLLNGVVSYGISNNMPDATRIAFAFCQSNGQACHFIGCR